MVYLAFCLVGGGAALFGWFMRGLYQEALAVLERGDFWEQEHYDSR